MNRKPLVDLVAPCSNCGIDDQAKAAEACELVDGWLTKAVKRERKRIKDILNLFIDTAGVLDFGEETN